MVKRTKKVNRYMPKIKYRRANSYNGGKVTGRSKLLNAWRESRFTREYFLDRLHDLFPDIYDWLYDRCNGEGQLMAEECSALANPEFRHVMIHWHHKCTAEEKCK